MENNKSLCDDNVTFNLENINNIENLNDYHLNQLNNQLRYELRNLSNEVGMDVQLSDDDVGVDVGVDVDVDIDKIDHLDHNAIENALNNAFNESDSEPFKNYIKSIVNRGQNSNSNHIPHLQLNNQTGLNLNVENGNLNIDDDVINDITNLNNTTKNNNSNNGITILKENNDNQKVRGNTNNNESNKSSVRNNDNNIIKNSINNTGNINNNKNKLHKGNEDGIPLKTKRIKIDKMCLNLNNIPYDNNKNKKIDKNNDNDNGNTNNKNSTANIINNIINRTKDTINFEKSHKLINNTILDLSRKCKKPENNVTGNDNGISAINNDNDNENKSNNNKIIDKNNGENSINASITNNLEISSISNIRKCSRCRMKRLLENEHQLEKYQTCVQCRERRKVRERKPRVLFKLPNLSDDWHIFLSKVALNNVIDLYQHNYRAYSEESEFPRYLPNELTHEIVQNIGEKIVERYVHPLQEVTGFKFAVRDHHNPSFIECNRAKKITWMFICSQDKFRRRKSRSENKRNVLNRLKTEECCSKISLSYDIVHGIIQMSYNHKHHKPLEEQNNLLNSSHMMMKNGKNQLSIEDVENNKSGVSRADIEAAAAAVVAVTTSGDIEDIYEDNNEDDNNNKDNNNKDGKEKVTSDRVITKDIITVTDDKEGKNNAKTGEIEFEEGQFENIEDINIIGDVEGEIDGDIDVDVEDVAEIAKILRQVQQAQTRRLVETQTQ